MTRFLAYFDLLGYSKFIENNTSEHLDRRTEHFARNIEMALSDGKRKESRNPGAYISDISQSNINTLNFSDTVIFWTNGNSFQDFVDIIKVSFAYNYFNVGFDFPSRGCIVYGDIWFKDFSQTNSLGSRYMLNMIYGKALIDAHRKAENLNWAGCVIDNSAIDFAKQLGSITTLLLEHSMLYDVPYKNSKPIKEYALKLIKGGPINAEALKNISNGISSSFTQDNKGELIGRAKEMYDNTVTFLAAH